MATIQPDPKIDQFSELLKDAFPGDDVLDLAAGDRSTHFYRIDRAGKIAHRIYVSREFFNDHTAEAIGDLFREWGMAETIRAAGPRMVTVTNSGLAVAGT
jgi:hypothetical protein